jgi:hypothetical protein
VSSQAGRSRFVVGVVVLLAIAVTHPAQAQEPAPGEQQPSPAEPSAPPAAPPPGPLPVDIPVIPEVRPIGPPPTVPSAPPRFLPTLRVGGQPTATFQLVPSLTLSEEYTDNFNLSERDKESNFRSSVAPGLQLLINRAFVKGVAAYTFSPTHDTSTNDIGLFHSFLGQVAWDVSPRWRLTVADALTRGDEPSSADRLGLRQERQTFTSNIFSFSSDYTIGKVATRQSYRMSLFTDDDGGDTTSHSVAAVATVPLSQTSSLSAGYDYLNSTTSSDDDGSTGGFRVSANDVTGHRLTGSVSRQVTALRSVGLSGSYAFRTVDSETGTDYQLWNVAAFTSHTLPGRLTLDVSLGVSALRPETEKTLGPHFSTATALRYQFARAVATLAIDRGFSETFSEGEDFGVVETTGGAVSLAYPFTPFLSSAVGGFYRRSKFTDVTGDDPSETERTTNWGGSLSLSWRIIRNLLLELSYSYVRQKGDEGQFDGGDSYTENRVRAALIVSF